VTAFSSECVLNRRKRAHIQCCDLQAWAVRIVDNEAASEAKRYCADLYAITTYVKT